MSALSDLKQRLLTVNHSAIALCIMIDANPLPDGIACASVLAALFLFRAMLYTHAGRYDKVRTLWICTLFVITMQMTKPIAMFHRFFWHPSCKQFVLTMLMCSVLIMLVVECLEDAGCGCEETLP
jgi:hypothetical protein